MRYAEMWLHSICVRNPRHTLRLTMHVLLKLHCPVQSALRASSRSGRFYVDGDNFHLCPQMGAALLMYFLCCERFQ